MNFVVITNRHILYEYAIIFSRERKVPHKVSQFKEVLMDYKQTAAEILSAVGGKENIISAAHCATRLRLVISDNSRVDNNILEEIDGVKGVFEASGQLQIIIGTGAVNKVYDELAALGGFEASSTSDVKKAAVSKMPWYKRAVKLLGDIFVPIIPAIVASGLLMGLMEGFANLFPGLSGSDTYRIFHLFSSAAFNFLPILIAVSAAKTFGGNQFLGAVIGMIMIHGDLMNAWSVSSAEIIPTAGVWFGLYDINMVGYQGHVIPVVIAVWLMSVIEKKLHKIVPEMIDLFVTPLVTVLATGYVTLTIIGPVFGWLESMVLNGVQWLISVPFGIGGALCGAVYAPTVVAGIHHMYNALEAGLLSSQGVNTWMPIATTANVAQGAAALAFSIKTKNRKNRSVALPASLSAFLGITEPAIFGVNLRFFKPFLAGCIGGMAGGLVAGLLNVGASAYGITGVFGVLITTKNLWQYLLVMGVAFAAAFFMTMLLYKDKNEDSSSAPQKSDAPENVIYAPLEGNSVSLESVPDETFSTGVLGLGAAVIPPERKSVVVYSPDNGTVSTLFDTHHAIGLTLDSGAEILIHIGINTVALEGKYFKAFVNEGDRVSKGQKLIEFNSAEIKAAGYETVTPVIVTNSEEYSSVKQLKNGQVTPKDGIIILEKGE